MKKIILAIMAMGLVMSGVSFGYDDYIELTPVPEEMIVEIAMKNYMESAFSHEESTSEHKQNFYPRKVVYDCELVPLYNLNGDVMSYFAILFFEGTPKQPWEEIMKGLSTGYEEYSKAKEKIESLDIEIANLRKKLEKVDSEDERELIMEKIEEIGELSGSINKEFSLGISREYRGRDDYFNERYYANFEQQPGTHGGGRGLPKLLYDYWDAVDYLKGEFNTDDIEFVNFLYAFAIFSDFRYGICYQFKVDGEDIILSQQTDYFEYHWAYKKEIEDKVNFDMLYKEIDDKYVDEWYEILEYVREKHEKMYPDE